VTADEKDPTGNYTKSEAPGKNALQL